jgi:preprotein translocase subunit SecA
MTGTAHTEATEFGEIYKLDCIVMPTNRILQRKNNSDCIYRSKKEKFSAVVEEIAQRYEKGQPVLVGTISIENSEILSTLLKHRGVPHEVLNAKYHEREAHIVAQAGRYKAVTIATNMAGRGTDIVLGGNPEFLAHSLADEKGQSVEDEAEKKAMIKKFLDEFRVKCKEEHNKVVEVGGLYVLGTERHESRRIDNQLRGRSGRQGDPGESRFYVSLEDDLMRLFASDKIMGVMDRLGFEEGQVIEHPWVSRSIEIAQKRVETHNFEIRKQLLEFDNVMNKQREVIYSQRRTVLESDNVKDRVMEAVEDTITYAVGQYLFNTQPQETEDGADAWDAPGFEVYLKSKFNLDISSGIEKLKDMTQEQITTSLTDTLKNAYQQKENNIGAEHMRHLEKILLLHTIDAKWKDHLYAMDQLKDGIGWRSLGQRDPVIEYKREGFAMFQQMQNLIHQEVAETIFKVQPVSEQTQYRSVFSALPQKTIHDEYTSLNQSGAVSRPGAGQAPEAPSRPKPVQHDGPKVGRNDPCPCGSGKKYKKCCGQ